MLAEKIKHSVARLRELAARLPEEQRHVADRVAAVLDACEEIAANLEAVHLPITEPAQQARLQ
jgi:hypothetical protein